MKKLVGLTVLLVVCLTIPMPAAEKAAGPLLVNGFEELKPGDALPVGRPREEWSRADKPSTVTVVENAKEAAEGKCFLKVVATGAKIEDKQFCQFLKIEQGATESAIYRSLNVDPQEIQGKKLHFSVKARGKGFVHFYLYRTKRGGGGAGANPFSPTTAVSSDWTTVEWTTDVQAEPEVGSYDAAIHFFTYDNRGIDLDDFKLVIEP